MIRAVLDTNTLASGAIARGGTIGALIDAWLLDETFEVVLSQSILTELTRTLTKPYFTHRLSREDSAGFLAAVHAAANVIQIVTPIPTVVTTRADNLVLATAESGGASYVVSGDMELQRLGTYHEIIILSPREFLSRLQAPDRGVS